MTITQEMIERAAQKTLMQGQKYPWEFDCDLKKASHSLKVFSDDDHSVLLGSAAFHRLLVEKQLLAEKQLKAERNRILFLLPALLLGVVPIVVILIMCIVAIGG